MALRTIVKEGDEVLRKKARQVAVIDDRIKEIVEDMVETMRAEQGVGLAAPQVGILRRIIVVELDGVLYRLINPEIIQTQGEQFEEEACLSVPGWKGRVKRPKSLTIRGLNPEGEEVSYQGEDLLAVAFSHECDHLDGVLYIDLAQDLKPADELEDEEEEAGEGEEETG